MGFDEGKVFLDNKKPDGSYSPGDIIQGRLVFHQNKQKTFRGLYVVLKGWCDVHWTTRETRTVNDRKETYTVNHNSHEEYVNHKVYLRGNDSGETTLNPGEHTFPFQLLLPTHCPSSYDGGTGRIRYELKFVVDRAFKFDQEMTIPIDVVAIRDLNMEPACKEPIHMDFEETYCCWCAKAGICEVKVHVRASGFCPGQTIPIEVSCANNSRVEIDEIKFEITEKTKFIATNRSGTREHKSTIAKIKKGPVEPNSTRNWTLEMQVPHMAVYNLDACQYIRINYKFHVEISTSGCHTDASDQRRIVLGHVPLREFDDGPAPLAQADATAPLTNQPGGYPVTNQPYPTPQTAYPAPNPTPGFIPNPTNPPYPGNSPYPNPNLPYPGGSPYPGVAQPAENPYIGGQPAVSPYPGVPQPTGSPYPGASQPSVTPYPAPSPYPVAPQPGVSPYPAPSPYPGFSMPGNSNKEGVMAPLLPPGAGVPYPLNDTLVRASAPNPSSPDTEEKKPIFENDPAPPYNPEFMKQDK